MKAAPQGFSSLLGRMPRWFVEHARKTELRGRRRRAAQAARFEMAFSSPVTRRAEAAPTWADTVADWQAH